MFGAAFIKNCLYYIIKCFEAINMSLNMPTQAVVGCCLADARSNKCYRICKFIWLYMDTSIDIILDLLKQWGYLYECHSMT